MREKLMNKYLEKVAAAIPRFLARAAKSGLSKTMAEAEGTGARAARAASAANKSRDVRNEVLTAQGELNAAKEMSNRYRVPASQNTNLGSSEARLHKAKMEDQPGVHRRAARAAHAAALSQKGSKNALKITGVTAAAGAGALTGGIQAATKKD
jgi:hypothetical protein